MRCLVFQRRIFSIRVNSDRTAPEMSISQSTRAPAEPFTASRQWRIERIAGPGSGAGGSAIQTVNRIVLSVMVISPSWRCSRTAARQCCVSEPRIFEVKLLPSSVPAIFSESAVPKRCYRQAIPSRCRQQRGWGIWTWPVAQRPVEAGRSVGTAIEGAPSPGRGSGQSHRRESFSQTARQQPAICS
jgi:hypothetical protein